MKNLLYLLVLRAMDFSSQNSYDEPVEMAAHWSDMNEGIKALLHTNDLVIR